MLTLVEKIIFSLAALATIVAAFFAIRRLARIIGAGQGRPDWSIAWKRLANVLARAAVFQPVFRFRPVVSLFHGFVGCILLPVHF